MAENKYKRKARRKQTKAKNMLFKDTGISCSDRPTKVCRYVKCDDYVA
jgi:hypothetical protein